MHWFQLESLKNCEKEHINSDKNAGKAVDRRARMIHDEGNPKASLAIKYGC